MSFLTNPYVYGVLIAITTATVVYAYQHTVDTSTDNTDAKKKTFYKTLGAGVVSSLALAYFIHRPRPVATDPFPTEAPVITSGQQ